MAAEGKDKPRPSGTIIGGYTLLEEVGRGGMGSVYRATGPDGAVVAVKLLASHLTSNPVLLQRFKREAELAERLDHPNLVRAIKLGEENGAHFFAMEYVDGESLGARLKKLRRFQEKEAVRICTAVALALGCAHERGLIHRDVKPDNVMLTSDGRIKVADMGLAKDLLGDDLNLTKTGRGLGTPHFMAPEQFKEAKNADVRCDVYSLGATLYTLVTGQLPFRAASALDTFMKKSHNEYTPPEELNPDLSPRLVRTIKSSMDADPSKRPQSMAAFIALLGAAPSHAASADKAEAAPSEAFWYVIHTDTDGNRKKIKGREDLLIGLIRQGRIGPDAAGSKEKVGPFLPLGAMERFRKHFAGSSAAPVSEDLDAVIATALSTSPSRSTAAIPTVGVEDGSDGSPQGLPMKWAALALLMCAVAAAATFYFWNLSK